MGMYSAFENEYIKVTDAKGLTEYLFKVKESDDNYGDYMYKDFLEGIIDGKPYSFESWDNIKLISYWYKDQVEFLIELSKYIEGKATFSFETGEERATIKFKEGETIFNLGTMEYHEFNAKDFLGRIK